LLAAAGAELGPVELLHQDPVSVIADHVVTPQLESALPRDRNRLAPERPAGHFADKSYTPASKSIVIRVTVMPPTVLALLNRRQ